MYFNEDDPDVQQMIHLMRAVRRLPLPKLLWKATRRAAVLLAARLFDYHPLFVGINVEALCVDFMSERTRNF